MLESNTKKRRKGSQEEKRAKKNVYQVVRSMFPRAKRTGNTTAKMCSGSGNTGKRNGETWAGLQKGRKEPKGYGKLPSSKRVKGNGTGTVHVFFYGHGKRENSAYKDVGGIQERRKRSKGAYALQEAVREHAYRRETSWKCTEKHFPRLEGLGKWTKKT